MISLVVAFYALKAYRLSSEKSFLLLYFGFSILSTSMFTRVLGTIYLFVLAGATSASLRGLLAIVNIVYGLMRVLSYILFTAAYIRQVRSSGEASYAVALPFILSPSLEFLGVVFLLYVVIQLAINFMSTRNFNSFLVLLGFLLLFMSHIAFMVSILSLTWYLVGHLLQLSGFTSLLIMLVRVSRVK